MNFASAKPSKRVSVSGKLVEVRMQRDLFGQLLLVALEETLDIDKVLSYTAPLPMCHVEGGMCKTGKSVLL